MVTNRETPGEGPKLVAIDREKLRAAWKASTYSTWEDLATALDTSHVRLIKIANGKTKRCQRSFAVRLAEKLDVRLAWLTGEEPYLPYVPLPGILDPTGEAGWILDDPRVRELLRIPPDAPAPPPAWQIAMSRFLDRCAKALDRDFTEHPNFERRKHQLIRALSLLIDPESWRLLIWPGRKPDVAGSSAVALAEAWSEVLGPWLMGQASLDLRPVLEIARLMQRADVPSANLLNLDVLEAEFLPSTRRPVRRKRDSKKRR